MVNVSISIMMKNAWIVHLLLLWLVSDLAGGTVELPVYIDGKFSDWDSVAGSSDFKATSDAERVYVYFSVPSALVLQNDSGIRIGFDSDGNPDTGNPLFSLDTGQPVAGTGGFEIIWNCGTRRGSRYDASGDLIEDFRYVYLGLLAAPVIDSTEFEIAVNSDLFTGDTMRVMAIDGMDRIIGEAEGPLSDRVFEIDRSSRRNAYTDFRLCSYNVLFDAPWKSGRLEFEAELAEIAPDVIAFQEIYNHSDSETLAWVQGIDPAFQHSVRNNDCHVVSKYPIERSWALDGNLAAQVRIPGGDVLVVSVHLPGSSAYGGRASELGTIQELIENIRQGTLEPGVSANIPFVMAGDCNFVHNDSAAIRAFEQATDSVEITAFQLNENADYTWEDGSANNFSPGRLDWAFASAGIVALNGFVFKGGQASDHMPLVIDFAFDSDDDAMPDSWEQQFFGNLDETAAGDADSDSFSNLIEYRAGTDPVSSSNYPGLSIEKGAEHSLLLKWPSYYNAAYSLEESFDLRNWAAIGRLREHIEQFTVVEIALSESAACYRLWVE